MQESDILRSLKPPVPTFSPNKESSIQLQSLVTVPPTTVLVITGMHRSGTSLIATILQEAGVHLGDELIGPNTGNIRGHFEDIEFVKLHQTILQSQNLDMEGWMIQPHQQILPESIPETIPFKKAINLLHLRSILTL